MDQIREQQIAEARRMTAGLPAVKWTIRGAKLGSKPTKKPEGHEAFLKQLEASKAEIEIVTMDGEVRRGVVRHSDKFTISIKPKNSGSIVFFKHAIESFEPTEPAPNAPTNAQQ